jgi:excisionase family DNA binding protein
MKDGSQLLRVTDLATAVGVSTSRIYQLLRARELPAVRIGGAIRVPLEAWEKWLAEQRDRALEAVRRS